jgi:hypothetical protein
MTIIKKSRKPVAKKSPKRKFDAGGDILADALSGRYRELTGPSGPRNPITTSAGADTGGPGKDLVKRGPGKDLVKRGAGKDLVRSGNALARSGPSIDVDMPKRLRGIKDIGSGTGERVSRAALEGPSKAAADTATKSASKLGGLGRLAGRLSGPIGMALTPSDLGSDDTKTGYDAMKPVSKDQYLKNSASKVNMTRGTGFKADDSGPSLKNEANVGPPRPLGPTKSASKPVAKAATKAATANRKAASDDDAFMADLRASAARMKSATADAAQKTGSMKDKMSDFAGSFKKGGKMSAKAKPAAKAYAKGGLVKSSKSINGCAKKGLTRGASR